MNKGRHRIFLCTTLVFSILYVKYGLVLSVPLKALFAGLLGSIWGTVAFVDFLVVNTSLSVSDRKSDEVVFADQGLAFVFPLQGLLMLTKRQKLESAAWPSLELAGAMVGMVFVMTSGLSWSFVFSMILFHLFAQICVFDLRERLINEKDLLALLLVPLASSITLDSFPLGAEQALAGAFLGAGLLWLTKVVTEALTGSSSVLGTGDIWLVAGIGCWVGYYILPVLLTAAVLICLQHILNRTGWLRFDYLDRPSLLPFGPSLSLSGYAGWIVLNQNHLV